MKTIPPGSKPNVKAAMAAAMEAAHAAGKLMRKNLASVKKVNETTAHDIKLELDVRCQKTIERILFSFDRRTSILGEEGVAGNSSASWRWVVDPIDGTVNFTYGIPHACVSIALQERTRMTSVPLAGEFPPDDEFETVLGVVYDPFLDEMWSAVRLEAARLNGRKIVVSDRRLLGEAIVAMGFAKYETTLEKMLPVFNNLVHRVRKIRLLGAAALSMVWVAGGRMDVYQEYGLRLWDIAAGGLIVEAAGGEFWRRPIDGSHAYEIIASNGHLRPALEKLGKKR